MTAQPHSSAPRPPSRLTRWLLGGGDGEHVPKRYPWWQVMCLTGVDYFSTLGYQPGIAALAAGAVSPLATLVLVALTLFGALPVYSRVAAESPHGEGSISMLERLLGYWPGKLLVLALLGFMATDFIITITLSAADASAHLIENPFFRHTLSGQQLPVTLGLVLLLGAVFLRGFREAISISVLLVAVYLGLNGVVMVRSLLDISQSPVYWQNWREALFAGHASPLALAGVSLLVFPKLALGLSGFETGVAVMPQVRGSLGDLAARPEGRIRHTRRLLLTAAAIMSVFLVISSLVTTLLIPPPAFWPETSTTATVRADDLARGTALVRVGLDDSAHPSQVYPLALPAGATGTFSVRAELAGRPNGAARSLRTVPLTVSLQPVTTPPVVSKSPPPALVSVTVSKPAGAANGRALAYLAHRQFGERFGTVYDFSTIFILWFAGASAMAGLVNIVPRFLPRYGMAPEWTNASRPLVLIYTALSVIVTLVFRANVDAQGGAYATGVLVLMTSASVAVTLLARERKERSFPLFAAIALVFIYTTVLNMFERPEGLLIGVIFILLILAVSLASRILRSFELRVSSIELSESARALLASIPGKPLRFVAHHPGKATEDEYHIKEMRARQLAHLPDNDPFLFLEVEVEDASDFSDAVDVQGLSVGPYRILRARGSSVPNTIAALMLHLRADGPPPQVYFQWSNEGPLPAALRFLVAGEGDVPPLTHEILRRSEPDKARRPVVHVGG
ncbi:APC family permease [Deinococcus sp.]|uniref:APC family permease n=1 Tax=Deinococcus sp. TaxID=47478 RepID=UPI003CC5FF1D